MPFGFWVLGDGKNTHRIETLWQAVSNAFRLLGSGGRIIAAKVYSEPLTSLKCLSAFGFWGTGMK